MNNHFEFNKYKMVICKEISSMIAENEYKILVGGYFGIMEMDEYVLKEYVLHDIEIYIKDFIAKQNSIDFNYQSIAEELQNSLTLKRKLQDSLLTLKRINGPFELEHMIKLKLQDMKKER